MELAGDGLRPLPRLRRPAPQGRNRAGRGKAGTQASAPKALNPFAGARGYVDPHSPIATAARSLQATNPSTAALLTKLAANPTAFWLGDTVPAVRVAQVVHDRIAVVEAAGALPVLVLYAIPHRDCGSYSSGGFANALEYRAWVSQIADGIGSSKVAIILEPDALASEGCLSRADQVIREKSLAAAVTRLGQQPNTSVYLDAGNERWQSAAVMTARLRAANVAAARGFSLNVSNFYSTATEEAYGDRLSAGLGGKHYVIDTSRNGVGSNGTWCNPAGRSVGTPWSTANREPSPGRAAVDQDPGVSDGTCSGGPPAGRFWPDYAARLAAR